MARQELAASPKGSRRYATPKRDQRAKATRAAILAAAEALFLRNGYVATSMKAIAAQAGVSEKTMYLTFATKATLLRQVIQLSVQGDEEPTPLSQRPEWRALFAGPMDEVFVRFAALNAALMTRTAAIIAVGESAASTDPELAEYRDRAHAATRATFARSPQNSTVVAPSAPASANKTPRTPSTPWPPTKASSYASRASAAGHPPVTPTSSRARSRRPSGRHDRPDGSQDVAPDQSDGAPRCPGPLARSSPRRATAEAPTTSRTLLQTLITGQTWRPRVHVGGPADEPETSIAAVHRGTARQTNAA